MVPQNQFWDDRMTDSIHFCSPEEAGVQGRSPAENDRLQTDQWSEEQNGMGARSQKGLLAEETDSSSKKYKQKRAWARGWEHKYVGRDNTEWAGEQARRIIKQGSFWIALDRKDIICDRQYHDVK